MEPFQTFVFFRRETENPGEVDQRLRDVELSEERHLLGHVADAGAWHPRVGPSARWLAEDDDGPVVELQLADDAFQEGRFAASRRA